MPLSFCTFFSSGRLRNSAVLAALAMSFLLSGCSSSDNKPQAAELVSFKEQVKIKTRWSASGGTEQSEYQSAPAPALIENRLYIVDEDGEVSALETQKGRTVWDTDLETSVNGSIGANNTQVFVGTLEGDVVALMAGSGEEQWRTNLGSEIISAPVATDKQALVQTVDGRLYALDAKNGEQQWIYEIELPVLTLRGNSQSRIVGDTAYASFDNGKVVAIELSSGGTRWEGRLALPKGRTDLERMVDSDAGPLVKGDVVYASAYQGRLMAFSRGTGRPLWSNDVASVKQMDANSGSVFVVTDKDEVRAYQAYSGELLWQNDQLAYRKLSGVSVFANLVAVADAEGYLHLLSPEDGQFMGRKKIDGSGIFSPMVSDGETLYVQDASGGISALEARAR